MNNCYLCNSSQHTIKKGTVRDNPSIQILECSKCGLVFLSSFEHIQQGFYENSGMHDGTIDIDAWLKETARDDNRRLNALSRVIENKNVLDFGCGNGGFLAGARDIARNVVGIEPDNSVRERFRQINVPVYSDIKDVPGLFDIITLFHVLEHLPDPRAILKNLSEHLDYEGQLIIEVPSASDALLSIYQCAAFSHFTYWSCHLYQFTQPTLMELAKQAGLAVNYVRQTQRYPLSNHLYWLANGKPGGHQRWSFLDSPELHAAYEKQLAAVGACDTIIASFSKVPL